MTPYTTYIATTAAVYFSFTELLTCCLTASSKAINVLGEDLARCSDSPLTGWLRDGYCNTDDRDHGFHVVCAEMTPDFLNFTKAMGNDLSTPNSHFPGLKTGDRWCLCAARWEEARQKGVAPNVVLDATNKVALDRGLSLKYLKQHDVTFSMHSKLEL